MRITIDGEGRIVLPEEIIKSAGLNAGTEIEVSLCDCDVIEMQPAQPTVHIEKRGHLFVAVPVDSGPVLTEDVVQTTLDELRQARTLA